MKASCFFFQPKDSIQYVDHQSTSGHKWVWVGHKMQVKKKKKVALLGSTDAKQLVRIPSIGLVSESGNIQPTQYIVAIGCFWVPAKSWTFSGWEEKPPPKTPRGLRALNKGSTLVACGCPAFEVAAGPPGACSLMHTQGPFGSYSESEGLLGWGGWWHQKIAHGGVLLFYCCVSEAGQHHFWLGLMALWWWSCPVFGSWVCLHVFTPPGGSSNYCKILQLSRVSIHGMCNRVTSCNHCLHAPHLHRPSSLAFVLTRLKNQHGLWQQIANGASMAIEANPVIVAATLLPLSLVLKIIMVTTVVLKSKLALCETYTPSCSRHGSSDSCPIQMNKSRPVVPPRVLFVELTLRAPPLEGLSAPSPEPRSLAMHDHSLKEKESLLDAYGHYLSTII